MSQDYQVKLTGVLLQGRAPDQGLQLLNDLFQIPLAEGRALLQGKASVLPRKLDKDSAEQICHRFRNVGVECSLEIGDESDYQLELIQEGPEPSPVTTTPENDPPKATLEDLTQQLAETEKDLADSAFVLELIPIEGEEKPLPEVGRIHVPKLAPELKLAKSAQPDDTATTDTQENPTGDDPKAAGAAATATAEGAEEEINVGQATATGSIGLGGMLPQASTQPAFRRPDEILAAKPASKVPLYLVVALALLLAAGAGYWYLFLAPSQQEAPLVAAPVPGPEPVEVDTTQFTAFEIDETKARLANLAKSLRTWQLEFNAGKPLPEQTELMKSLQKDLGLTEADWRDAWGFPVSIQSRLKGYILVSPGLDGKIDTQDDIDLILDTQPEQP